MMPGLRPFRHHLVDLRQYVRDIPDNTKASGGLVFEFLFLL